MKSLPFPLDDFTFYLDDRDAGKLVSRLRQGGTGESNGAGPPRTDFELDLAIVGKDDPETCAVGRALACRTEGERGPAWSITFRKSDTKPAGEVPGIKVAVPSSAFPIERLSAGPLAGARAWKPKGPRKGPRSFANSWEDIVTAVASVIHPATARAPLAGLIAVFGGTGSGKSELARGLVDTYLADERTFEYYKNVRKRRPHLLTVEDPVEKRFWRSGAAALAGEALDYTPRQRGSSATDLELPLRSALRQTPTVVYVGETRRADEWRHVIQFAGTGHLAVTTAHAGSLAEAVGTLASAWEARTPAARKDLADRIHAVIHLVAHRLEVSNRDAPGGVVNILVPSLWMGTLESRHRFTSEGRASILPSSGWSRYSFASRLLDIAEENRLRPVDRQGFLGRVRNDDLEGL